MVIRVISTSIGIVSSSRYSCRINVVTKSHDPLSRAPPSPEA